MKNRNVMSGASPLENRQVYVSPEAGTVEMELRDLIAVSADGTKVEDPWGGNEERNW